MQKDALNNVHITDEQVLITPDQLKAEFPLSLNRKRKLRSPVRPYLTLSPAAIRVCWWCVDLARFTIQKRQLNTLVVLKHLPKRSAIASTW
jgi:hypothetical protein